MAGLIAVRENEISKETDIREVGAIFRSCGHRQSKATESGMTRSFPHTQGESLNVITATFGRPQGKSAKSLLPTYTTIAMSIRNTLTQKRQS